MLDRQKAIAKNIKTSVLKMAASRGQQERGKVYRRDSWIPRIKIKGFVVLRGWIKGFCPRIPVFLSKFVRESHPVADPSGRLY